MTLREQWRVSVRTLGYPKTLGNIALIPVRALGALLAWIGRRVARGGDFLFDIWL